MIEKKKIVFYESLKTGPAIALTIIIEELDEVFVGINI